MTEQNLPATRSILDNPLVLRVRRNHGLEHATLHLLARQFPTQPLAGHSDAGGFWIIGDVSTDALQSAIAEALQRLRSGERKLAVHPNCGTNFVTGGVLAGATAALTMLGVNRRLRDQLDRLPLAIMLATLALILAQPLGLKLQQQVTTSADPGGLRVVEIRETRRGGIKAHRILTAG